MRDFNYFEPYITVTEKPDRKKYLFVVLILLAVLALVYYHYTLMVQVRALKSDMQSLDLYLNDSRINQQVSVIDAKLAAERELSSIYNDIIIVKHSIEMEESVNALLVDSVNAQMPEDVFLTQLTLFGSRLSITGYSKSMDAISQFGFNLRNIGPFYDVNIPTITEIEGQYQFAIYATWTQGGTQ